MTTPVALTIAGSDSGGGAGIQADLKSFSANGVYGASVITALTAQNTKGVDGVHPVPAAFVGAQMDSVFSDLAVDAVKIGMLANAGIIEAVATGLKRHHARQVVLDPVMVATSGDRLIDADAVSALLRRLIPLCDLITPNLAEAAALLGSPVASDEAAMAEQARALLGLGARAALIKGGHGSTEESVDLLATGDTIVRLAAPRIRTRNTHGTGCTLSAAIAAFLARDVPLAEAVDKAKTYVTEAIRAADRLIITRDGRAGGHEAGDRSGHGPTHHFHRWW